MRRNSRAMGQQRENYVKKKDSEIKCEGLTRKWKEGTMAQKERGKRGMMEN